MARRSMRPSRSACRMAVQFMNTSGPVRVMEPAEIPRAPIRSEFGLDQPQTVDRAVRGLTPVIAAHFGGRNPDGFLQYMTVEGRRQLFLLSRFVGQEWDAVAKATLQP